MNYKGKHLSKNRKSFIKYGLMITFSGEGNFLIKVIKRTPNKYIFYESINDHHDSVLQTKKALDLRIEDLDYDDYFNVDENVPYKQIECSDDEAFYRYSSLKDKLKKL